MRKTVKYSGILLLLISFSLVIVWSFFIEPKLIMVRNVSIDIPHWNKEHKNLKIVLLTDFHIGFGHMSRKNLAKIIERTNSYNPDIVLLLGDYVNLSAQNQKYLPFLVDFKKLRSKYGVFAIMGNHESWEVRNKIRYFIKQAGIKLLENRAEKITIDEKSFWIAGIDDLTTGYPDLEKTMSQIRDAQSPVLFLSHNPDIFEQVSSRVSLTLTGHTHGGQIYVPFLVRLMTPSRFGRRFLKGHVVQNNRHIFISSGLGTTIIPARFLVPPEIVILELE